MTFPFESLQVYQLSLAWVETTEVLVSQHRKSISHTFADQLTRAALSIPLNIAEGDGRWHKPDKRNFFWIARGPVFECVPLIEVLKRKGLIAEDDASRYRSQLTIMGKMLTNLVKAHEKSI